MDTDPTQDTVPSPALRRASPSPLGRFIRSKLGAFLILVSIFGVVLIFAAVGGFYDGVASGNRAAAATQSAELKRQSQLGLEDLAVGRYTLAVQRFEFILAIDPNFPGAAEGLAQARAGSGGAATPPPAAALTPPLTEETQTAASLFTAAQAAFANKDWDTTLQKVNALRVIDPEYERATVRKLLFDALRHQGLEYIQAGKLELGLADLDQASKIGALDTDSQQYQQWATIYINGMSCWDRDWQCAVNTFQILYSTAPYFRDAIARLYAARLAYAKQLEAVGDPCNAVLEYTAALDLQQEQPKVLGDQPVQAIEDKRSAAETACQFGTPTPDGTLTPFPTLEGTLTPVPPEELSPTPPPTDTPIPAH